MGFVVAGGKKLLAKGLGSRVKSIPCYSDAEVTSHKCQIGKIRECKLAGQKVKGMYIQIVVITEFIFMLDRTPYTHYVTKWPVSIPSFVPLGAFFFRSDENHHENKPKI